MRSSVARALVVAFAWCSIGCGKGDETAHEPPAATCAAGEWLREDGVCVPAGLPPDMPCPPAEWLRDDGTCIAAGVPFDGCGEGFVHDGNRGCEAILPGTPCAPGLMAVPGETTCREVAPCPVGTWGEIPVEPDTEYIDASYAGMDSDGSALKPWTSVQAGVDAASHGAIVAIAEGSYLEDVIVSGKSVRLWGVCPALVELVGTGAEEAAVHVLTGAAGTELRGLAIRGGGFGVFLLGSLDVLLERVWLHDNADRGIEVGNLYGPTGITLHASLVERNRELGAYVAGSSATVEASVIRDTQPNAQGFGGRGLEAAAHPTIGTPATLVVRSSLVEKNHDLGVFVEGSEASVEASVIRDTQPNAQGLGGRGVSVQSHPTTGARATLVVRTSVVEQSREFGVFVSGSVATVEASVVRATQLNALGVLGRGVGAQPYPTTGAPSTLVLRTSLVEQSREIGVFVGGSEATVEASAVRATHPNAQGFSGRGVEAHADPDTGASSTLVLRTSLVEQSYEVGVFLGASAGTVDASVIRATQPSTAGLGGSGLSAEGHPMTGVSSTLVLRTSLVEQSHEASVSILGSVATIDACLLRATHPSPERGAGEGVMVIAEPGAASATVTRTRIHESALAAFAAWGAHAAVGSSALSCQAFDLNTETYFGKSAALEDLGGNVCGCPEPLSSCKAVSAGLVPPAPLQPVQE